MHDPDAAQFIADALGIELTDTQRLLITDSAGHHITLGKPIPVECSHDFTQSQRGADAHFVAFDESLDARVAAYWGSDTDWDAPADGDGNPLHPDLRAEVDAERQRIRNAGPLSHLA